MDPFDTVKMEEDEGLLGRSKTKLQQYDILLELWMRDGFEGHSAIFLKEQADGLTDDELKKIVSEASFIKNKNTDDMTISRPDEGLVIFVNFDFVECDMGMGLNIDYGMGLRHGKQAYRTYAKTRKMPENGYTVENIEEKHPYPGYAKGWAEAWKIMLESDKAGNLYGGLHWKSK